VNLGAGVDTYKRYIYIHGTHEEGLIGQPVSHGCVRMRNQDVVELFDQLSEKALVLIRP
jgi:lipoprotein-anchoring transpeptidase ErfK/SrfK